MAGEETSVSADVAKAFGAKGSMPTFYGSIIKPVEGKRGNGTKESFDAAWNLKDEWLCVTCRFGKTAYHTTHNCKEHMKKLAKGAGQLTIKWDNHVAKTQDPQINHSNLDFCGYCYNLGPKLTNFLETCTQPIHMQEP